MSRTTTHKGQFSTGWPTGFRSRTSDPADPCYIGKARAYAVTSDANQFHFNTPASARQEKIYRSHHKAKPVDETEGYRFRSTTCRPRRIWLMLQADGPADLGLLATMLKIPQSTLAVLLEPAVRVGILEVSRAKPPVYSVGPVHPKGEPRSMMPVDRPRLATEKTDPSPVLAQVFHRDAIEVRHAKTPTPHKADTPRPAAV